MKDGYPMAKRILIADDERPIAELLVTALKHEGYETVGSTDSLRFFDAVREHRPDLILLDLKMPYLEGEDELRLLGMDSEIARIPVIVVTAHADMIRDEKEMRRMGVVEIVLKPFDLNDLISLIKQTIGDPEGVAR